jgi:hypothetical protein
VICAGAQFVDIVAIAQITPPNGKVAARAAVTAARSEGRRRDVKSHLHPIVATDVGKLSGHGPSRARRATAHPTRVAIGAPLVGNVLTYDPQAATVARIAGAPMASCAYDRAEL